MRPGPRLALALAALLAGAAAAPAAPGREPAPRVLVVGTKEAPPFSLKGPSGEWTGISVDLWKGVAADLGREYRFEERDLDGLLRGLEDGSLDASVAALTITSGREEGIDFSHPFHSTGLAVAVPRGRGAGWTAVVERFFSKAFLGVLAALSLVLLGAGFLVWLFERKANPEQFGGPARRGIGSAFWWSAVTMTTVGYGDKAPRTPGGRLVALVWMFTSVIIISGFTASITSSLTVNEMRTGIAGPGDLPGHLAGCVAGSTGEAALERRGVERRPFPDAKSALAALASGEVEAVVHDAPILLHLVHTGFRKRLAVVPGTFDRQDYGIALPAGSPLREDLNRALLRRLESPDWPATLERYLGE